MATVPTKPHKPLHNFPLPFLKWRQKIQVNTSDNFRRRDRYRNYPRTDSVDSDIDSCRKPQRFRNRRSEGTKSGIDGENGGVVLETGENSGKLCDVDVATTTGADGDVKPWNLRPRRCVISNVDGNGAVAGASGAKSGWLLRSIAAAEAEENEEDRRNKRRRLWISLSKEEIEEDVYAFTGSRPARRPKKRNRTAQKQVDNVFPGLYLVGISADSYRV